MTAVAFEWHGGWVSDPWVRQVVTHGVRSVSDRVWCPVIPRVTLAVVGHPLNGPLGSGAKTAPDRGVMYLDFARLLSGAWDAVFTVAHEAAHAVVGVTWHTPGPDDLLYPFARPHWRPWDGTLTPNDRRAFAAWGFHTLG